MNSRSEIQRHENGGFNISNEAVNRDKVELIVTVNGDAEAKRRADLVEWLNGMLPNLSLPVEASEEDLRTCLTDGTVLCSILNKLNPGCIDKAANSDLSLEPCSETVKRFLAAMNKMGFHRFELSDLEQGPMSVVLECLLALREQFNSNVGGNNTHTRSPIATSGNQSSKGWKLTEVQHLEGIDDSRGNASLRGRHSTVSGEDKRKNLSSSRFQRVFRHPVMSGRSAALIHHVGHKFHEVFQLKQGRYADIPASKISEMMKSNSLDNAPTQSLLSVVNGILDESIERKSEEIPYRVACLLRKVVQEIERRISTQAEHLRTQHNLYKAREEKYQSRITVLETLATGTSEETQIAINQLRQIKSEKIKLELKKNEEQDVVRLLKERDGNNLEISALKQKQEVAKKTYEQHCLQLETHANEAKFELEERLLEISALKQEQEVAKKTYEQRCMQLETHANEAKFELEEKLLEISALKQELEVAKKTYEQRCLQLETHANEAKFELEERLLELENLLADSRMKVKKLEAFSESKSQSWSKKENSYGSFMDFQFGALRELRVTSESVKQEILETQKTFSEEVNHLGLKVRGLADAAENYHAVLAENRRLYNEVQDLKGNIRVYCRIRPFLPGQYGKQTIIEYIGENGELSVVNPSKQGKESHRSFKFNKVFGSKATQEEVFLDTQPLIRSVLDGYNVCIFAYGQTGSGKTYTMTGPDASSEEDWGVNYRALNDLFDISQNRRSSINYEVGVQMVEIYNEQVRDLLSSDSSQKKLGICSTPQPSGLAVPDASMLPVKSTTDVLELMNMGLMNRAVGATAMNERSSRSHSVLTVHVRGTDLETGAGLHGSLHLVDLAGSERVDRSEATGDRLREAQYINKSLSALGDVIFALAQKSPHVPYRNSKLTQVLQSSLGGQAKTLMFVQLNPDVDSYSESLSTLKFAERVSGVELGAARSSKEGKDVRELMEQVAFLKDTIAKKDEEIEQLQLLKDLRTLSPSLNGEKRGTSSLRHGSSSSSRHSIGGIPQRSQRLSGGKGMGLIDKAASDQDNCSEYSDKLSESGSPQSMDDFRQQKEFFQQSRLAGGNVGQVFPTDVELSGFGDADSEERLSDISDGGLSMGTETDGSISSVVEYSLFPDSTKPAEKIENEIQVISNPGLLSTFPTPRSPSKIPPPPHKQGKTASPRLSSSKEASKIPTISKKSTTGSLSSPKSTKRWQ